MKIAINKCYGGFSVSREVVDKLRAKGHKITVEGEYYSDGSGPCEHGDRYGYHLHNEDFGIETKEFDFYAFRVHPDLIEAIETSENPNGQCSEIKIITIPDNIEWTIDEYDGIETVHEQHRSW